MEIKLTYIPSKKGKKWKTTNELKVELSDKSVLIIPKDFETDLSTVPKSLWGILPPFGNFLLGALVHDYLYVNKDERGRKFADKEMLIISNKHNKNKVDNYFRYYAVRLFGGLYWNDIMK
jgi:hypothetical protein